MSKKGFNIIELIMTILIIGIIGSVAIPAIFQFMDDEKIVQKTGILIKEFKEESTTEVKIKTVTIDRSGVKCIEGKKAIEIDNKIYYIGTLDTWGDIKGIECGE